LTQGSLGKVEPEKFDCLTIKSLENSHSNIKKLNNYSDKKKIKNITSQNSHGQDADDSHNDVTQLNNDSNKVTDARINETAEHEVIAARFNINSKKSVINTSEDKINPITIAVLKRKNESALNKNNRKHLKILKVLFDSGSTGNLISENFVKKSEMEPDDKRVWTTANGSFDTRMKAKMTILLPEFSGRKEVTLEYNLFPPSENMPYDVVIGTKGLASMKMVLDYDDLIMRWEEKEVFMKDKHFLTKENMLATYMDSTEPESVGKASKRVMRILDATYNKADLKSIIDSCTYLTSEYCEKLFKLLKKFESLFDGTLGDWKTRPVHLDLIPGSKPYHGKAYPIPKIYEKTLKTELARLEKIGVIQKCSGSEWGSPSFIIPKANGTVRFLTDFRKANRLLKRKPFPLPEIKDILQKLEGFSYATALDLNMGYYHIRLDPDAQKICTLILPWGKYEYLRLPMGLAGSPDIFQERMSELMADLEYARAYLDDLLCLTSGTFEDHLDKLEVILQRLQDAGLKVNAEKSKFAMQEIEYLGFLINRSGIKPLDQKVQAILNLDRPKNLKELRRVLGIVQYYRDLWEKRSHILAPLSDLVGENTPKKGERRTAKNFKWTEECEKAFVHMKRIVSREVLLAYPNFNKPFVIYTDASSRQLGAVITQDNRPIAFYSRKLNKAQRNYTVTDLELLSIVMTLKEFRSILLGQEILIYTDHKNLESDVANMTTQRLLRWRLLLEEYNIKMKYIKGITNTVSDALSRLDFTPLKEASLQMEYMFAAKTLSQYQQNTSLDTNLMSEFLFAILTPEDTELCPTNIQEIALKQLSCDELNDRMEQSSNRVYTKQRVNKIDNVILEDGRIFVPDSCRAGLVAWYHHWLLHPGADRLRNTIKTTFTWPGMRSDIENHVKTCHKCQMAKKSMIKYGKLPPKDAEIDPWHSVQVDCIGPYTVYQKNGNKRKKLQLRALTMIDPVTSWFEIAGINDSEFNSEKVSTLFHDYWLSRYPRPVQVIYDNGKEFQRFFHILCEEYNLNEVPTTVKNPQANGVIERVHQVIGNMLRSFDLDNLNLDPNDPFGDVLARIGWAVRSTYHTTLEASPGQLVFGRDMLFDIDFTADWHKIYHRRQEIINKNNLRENSKRIPYTYQVGDQVKIRRDYLKVTRKTSPAYEGPFAITEVRPNGTVRIQRGAVSDVINIRRIAPYFAA